MEMNKVYLKGKGKTQSHRSPLLLHVFGKHSYKHFGDWSITYKQKVTPSLVHTDFNAAA